MSELVHAMDTSSAQPRDLTGLIQQYGVSHVVVKLYQTVELIDQQYSLDQLASAQAAGCTPGGYLWLYGTLGAAGQVADALDLIRRAGVALPILWIDCETYKERDRSITYPTQAQALEAVEACESAGQRAGIYTGNWFVDGYWGGQVGELASRPVWLADYNGVPDLNTPSPYWPAEQVLGHQYQGNPVDLDVFDSSVTSAGTPPSGQPSYEELQSIIGYLTGDLMNGFESEANRKPIRKTQLLALVELGRAQAIN